MITNLRLNKILWYLVAVLSMLAAGYGVLNNQIYQGLIPAGFVAAQFSQDILTLFVGLILLFLISTTSANSRKKPIIILGIIGSLCYLYAIFSIERVYNVMYLIYLGIFSTSFFSVCTTIGSLRPSSVDQLKIPLLVARFGAILSILIALLFTVLWTSALLPLMQTGNQIDNLFSIYVLDLVFVMPAFLITATITLLKKPLGYVLTPAMFILGIFVIFPLGLGELAKPFFSLTPDYPSMTMSFSLAGVFLVSSIWQLKALYLNK